MASDPRFVSFVVAQLDTTGAVVAKKLFGEQALYRDGKLFGLICDGALFIKPTAAGRAFIGAPVEAPPYEGAKPYFLIEDRVEDPTWLRELVRLTLAELPLPAPKKKKGRA